MGGTPYHPEYLISLNSGGLDVRVIQTFVVTYSSPSLDFGDLVITGSSAVTLRATCF